MTNEPMTLKQLKNYTRKDFKRYVRKKYLKNSCEICGNTNDLTLHHIKELSQIINEILIEYDSLNNEIIYNTEEIRKKIINKTIEYGLQTLCNTCHKKIHGLL